MFTYEGFRKFIREIRLIHGYCQEELAKKLHLTRSAYTYIEKGPVIPRPDLIESLSQIYDIPAGMFLHSELYPKIIEEKQRTL